MISSKEKTYGRPYHSADQPFLEAIKQVWSQQSLHQPSVSEINFKDSMGITLYEKNNSISLKKCFAPSVTIFGSVVLEKFTESKLWGLIYPYWQPSLLNSLFIIIIECSVLTLFLQVTQFTTWTLSFPVCILTTKLIFTSPDLELFKKWCKHWINL